MKVYLVHHGEYSDYTVDAIFEDQDTAEKYCELHNKYERGWYTYEYEEWDTTQCVINMQKAKNQIGYCYYFDKKGHLNEEECPPKLKIQWYEDEEVHPYSHRYCVTIFENGRSEAQCRKIACDKVAAYRAMEELI
jgi:hypothetical protein